jgi:hypothetical protein
MSNKFKDVFIVVLDQVEHPKRFTLGLSNVAHLNVSKLTLSNKVELTSIFFNRNRVFIWISGNNLILTVFQTAKNLVV